MTLAGSPAGVVTGEIYVDQVELQLSGVCAAPRTSCTPCAELRLTRRSAGGRLLAAGVHPTACVGAADHRHVARATTGSSTSTPACCARRRAALQVHVGLPDETTAMLAYRGLRNRLPLLRALAAGSPYWHGLDSGQATARARPSSGPTRAPPMPPLCAPWMTTSRRTEALMAAAAEASDHTYVWWEMRPAPAARHARGAGDGRRTVTCPVAAA